MIDPDMALTYLEFGSERHRVWERRQAGLPQPWTDDHILASRKFTNTFRILDAGSQFLLGMLTDDLSERETLARCFLYRHICRPEPWEFFELVHGRFPLVEDLKSGELLRIWKDYRGGSRTITSGNSTLGGPSRKGELFDRPIFGSAYLIYPQSQTPGTDKLESIISLAARLLVPGSAEDILPDFLAATTQQDRFLVLKRAAGVGNFLAMQVLTDYGWTTGFREDEFVVPGPGAVKGLALVFPGEPSFKGMKWAMAQDLGVELAGRRPSLMDRQNLYCELFKFHRYGTKPSTSKSYAPAHPGPQPQPLLPKWW